MWQTAYEYVYLCVSLTHICDCHISSFSARLIFAGVLSDKNITRQKFNRRIFLQTKTSRDTVAGWTTCKCCLLVLVRVPTMSCSHEKYQALHNCNFLFLKQGSLGMSISTTYMMQHSQCKTSSVTVHNLCMTHSRDTSPTNTQCTMADFAFTVSNTCASAAIPSHTTPNFTS